MSPLPKFNVSVETASWRHGTNTCEVLWKNYQSPKEAENHLLYIISSCAFPVSFQGGVHVWSWEEKTNRNIRRIMIFHRSKQLPSKASVTQGKWLKDIFIVWGILSLTHRESGGKTLGLGPLIINPINTPQILGIYWGKKTKQTPGVCEVHVPCINITLNRWIKPMIFQSA